MARFTIECRVIFDAEFEAGEDDYYDVAAKHVEQLWTACYCFPGEPELDVIYVERLEE